MKTQKPPAAARPAATPPATAEPAAAPAQKETPAQRKKSLAARRKAWEAEEGPIQELYWEALQPGSLSSREPLALLPPSMVQKYLEIWEATGVNVAFMALTHLVNDITERGGEEERVVAYLESGWLWHLEKLGQKWLDREGRVPWWEEESIERAAQLAAERQQVRRENRAARAAAKAAVHKEVRP